MSIKKIFFFGILGFASAYVVSLYFENQTPSPQKGFATVQKRQIAGKTNAMMDILVEPIGGVPEHDEQEITLRATLTLKRPIDTDLNFKWILPDDVRVVAGHLEDGWNNIQPGQSVTTELTLTGLSKESPGKAAVLHVESTSQGFKVGYSGVYSIEPELPEEASPDNDGKQLGKVQKTKAEINSERLRGLQF